MSLARERRATTLPSLRAFAARVPWLEDVAVLLGAFLAALHAEWQIISGSLVFNGDAEIHEFWMRKFQDSALFQDQLTNALVDSGYQPAGFRGLYWVVSHVIDPVTFGELLPLLLQPLSVWLVFRIVRAHTPWWPAAWISAALFLVPWEILRFSGGHPRAFAHPIVLLAVFFLIRKWLVPAAFVPAIGLLFYPPAGLGALAIVLLSSFERVRRPFVNIERAKWGGVALVLAAAAVLLPRLAYGSEHLISEAQARQYPEFGPGGPMHFFATSTLDYLRNNYSGFFLRDSGSILAIAAIVLLVLRPRNAKQLRWEVWCMPVTALVLFAAAHAVLFSLYLPHRYTYPLLPFFCIVIGVTARPTLEALAARFRPAVLLVPAVVLMVALIALWAFPLGPQLPASRLGPWLSDVAPYLAVGLTVGVVLGGFVFLRAVGVEAKHAAVVGAAALIGGCLLVGEVAFAGDGRSPSSRCGDAGLYTYLRTLPKDAVVAGDPLDMNCVPLVARRPVVISRKLYQPWNTEYFPLIRERMFSVVRAYYGPSTAALVDLRRRFGADYFAVRTGKRTRPSKWPSMEPFTSERRRILRAGNQQAAQHLPQECETWRDARFAVYSLACVAERSQ
jgi:hypothetical protein